ncbi:MAG: hypothetical protein ABIA77_00925 [Candidatus Omnitrophota bacterium]
MIERMKKITLLVSEKERGYFILRLQEIGVVHVEHVNVPEDHELTFIEDKISKVEKLISELSPFSERHDRDIKEIRGTSEILRMANGVDDIFKERKGCVEEIRKIKEQIEWFKLWGDFDPADLAMLEEKGGAVRLYRLPKGMVKKLCAGPTWHIAAEKEGYTCLAKVTWEEKGGTVTGETGGGANDIPEGEQNFFESVTPPGVSPWDLASKLRELNRRKDETEEILRGKARAIGALKEGKKALESDRDFLKVKCGMAVEGKIAYLRGFCPVKLMGEVISMAKKHGIGYLADDPDDPDVTPTLISNPRWLRIIDPVFHFMNTVPGYGEYDISFHFLIFFSLFFAMLIGDAGYGLLFLAVTFFARRKFRKIRGEPFFLMYLLSGATIIWGAITGTWFGSEQIAQLPFFNKLIIPQVNSFADVSQDVIIQFCFFIGTVHLTIAHCLKGIRVINSLKAVAEAGWIMIIWGMFFAAGRFVLNNPFPAQAGWLLAGGISFVILCANAEKGVLKGALGTLANLPLSVISSFSDVVSYLRLFAVGYASVVMAESFNEMALAGGISSVGSGLIAAAILVMGHLLNIVLGFMAVIVHGIRLNMLEFSSHLGMQWSGKRYDPFGGGEDVT